MKKDRSRRGQGLVEFALGAVVLFTTLCGIFEFSWVFWNYSHLNNAVSKAARRAVVGANNADVGVALLGEQGGLRIATYSVTAFDRNWNDLGNPDARPVGGFVTVRASILYPNLTPLHRFVQMAGFGQLRSECTARIE